MQWLQLRYSLEDKDITMLLTLTASYLGPSQTPQSVPLKIRRVFYKGWAKHDWWRKWYSDNWGLRRMRAGRTNIELTDTKASFKFYTTSAFFEPFKQLQTDSLLTGLPSLLGNK